jgi:two-component sensor histidine kinase
MLLPCAVLPWLLGRWGRQYADLVSSGWRLADRMEREQRAVAERTRMRERARIAGDMHDSLGHDLTLLAVRAAVLEVDRTLDARQQAAVGELREAAAAATGRLREIIGVLRTDDEEGEASAAGGAASPASVVERARASCLDVVLEQRAETEGLPPMVGHAVHRVVQESLTNAAKHAPGAAVRVEVVREDGGTLRVTVANGAARRGAASPGPVGGGTGLVGLDERVRLAGGTLRAAAVPDGGFEVVARLPAVVGALPRDAGAAGASRSARELERARGRVRRRAGQAVLAPLAVLAAILVVLLPVSLADSALSVLDRERFDRLVVGETREETERGLPAFDRDGAPDGAPEEPRGTDCVYYSTRWMSDDAYRLCFSGERLVSRDVVRGMG